MENTKLLEIKDLRVQYTTDEAVVHAVNGLNLELEQGENLGLVGETGAGKSTTAYSILQLIAAPAGKIVSGEVFFEGTDLLKSSKAHMRAIRGNKISMIFQDPMTSLNPVYSVGKQIAEVIRVHDGCNEREARGKAEDLLKMVGISKERYDDYPMQFSGGMKQRVVIAMSIACNPTLILADEPTTALDVTIQAQVLELIDKLKNELNTSMLLITHDLGVVAQICDKVAIMYAGEIVEYGTREDIFLTPSHPYTLGLFDSLPRLDIKIDKLKPILGQMPDPMDLPAGCTFCPRCPYAAELCKTVKPGMAGLGDTHQVRCLFFDGRIESPELKEVVARGR